MPNSLISQINSNLYLSVKSNFFRRKTDTRKVSDVNSAIIKTLKMLKLCKQIETLTLYTSSNYSNHNLLYKTYLQNNKYFPKRITYYLL